MAILKGPLHTERVPKHMQMPNSTVYHSQLVLVYSKKSPKSRRGSLLTT